METITKAKPGLRRSGFVACYDLEPRKKREVRCTFRPRRCSRTTAEAIVRKQLRIWRGRGISWKHLWNKYMLEEREADLLEETQVMDEVQKILAEDSDEDFLTDQQ